ncbi:RNA polymerase sigma factor [Bacillus mesophilum]|uniref:RNA polymerase sigma factor n=1 Tax=Bacillus mesophilum TaxID=1071718 RepID=A0A7V7RJ33_9BACI|nr:RNA polymerase sigma factor [Bacillus mesophilum]KAB2330624.1 RNA polymerase sigma factor [Bacillus mesophilum]
MKEGELEALYNDYHQTIFKFIFMMVKDYQQAEDLTQEVFIRAYKKHHKFNNLSSVKTWLFRIAHNVSIDYLRKKRPIHLVQEFFQGKRAADFSPENILHMKERSKKLYEAIIDLKEPHRKVIILRKIKGFTLIETAEILNWTPNKVKAVQFRAMQALERKLSKEVYWHEKIH